MNKRILFITIALLMPLFSIESADILGSRLKPEVKACIAKNYTIKVDNKWKIICLPGNSDLYGTASRFSNSCFEDTNLLIPVSMASSADIKNNIILALETDLENSNPQLKDEIIPSQILGDEGYVIDIFRDHIVVAGNTPQGVFYGTQTLLQLFQAKQGELILDAVKIVDYPKTRFRGVHIMGANLDEAKELINMMARQKMNFVIFQSGKYYQLDRGDNLERLKEVFAYAEENYITAVPEISTFGVGIDVFYIDPMTAEGIFVDSERFRFVNNEAIPLQKAGEALINVIRSEDSDIVVKNCNGTGIFRENIDYKIIDGETNYPYPANARPTRILRINDGNIEDGDEILVSYDYVGKKCKDCEWSVPYCPSSERTYNVINKVLGGIMREFQPHYISVTHDEIRGMNRDSRCLKRNLSNAELLADELSRINDYVASYGLGTRLLIWDDMVNPWHNGGDNSYQEQYGGKAGKTSDAIYIMPNDIILMSWWYDESDNLSKMKNSPNFYSSQGFDYLAAGYKDTGNIDKWLNVTKGSKKCLGIIVTTWDGWKNNLNSISYAAQKAW
ncbi:MAG: glycoside hydrolase family 20 zincin-like fold domain-containing protein [Candidatus Omnitrophota bacterium]